MQRYIQPSNNSVRSRHIQRPGVVTQHQTPESIILYLLQ